MKSPQNILFLSIAFLLGMVLGVTVFRTPSPLSFAVKREPTTFPVLYTEQQMIEDLGKDTVDLNDVHAVFEYVFSQLPDSVSVYPTENYYYFQFFADRQHVWGNLRFEYDLRREGKLSFAYFGSIAKPETPADLDFLSGVKIFDATDGVLIQEVDPLTYSLTYKSKQVTFHLNDLLQDVPRNLQLQKQEKFFGRMFDESGFQFFLLYDTEHPQFRFVLDEKAPLPDVLEKISPTLFIGRLSSFGFYKHGNRLTLIGVYADSTRRNNYYDGPFDQLPDNFVSGSDLQKAMEAAYPYIQGRINERGSFIGSDGKVLNNRLAITPYINYSMRGELLSFIRYCEKRGGTNEVLLCLTHDYKQGNSLSPH